MAKQPSWPKSRRSDIQVLELRRFGASKLISINSSMSSLATLSSFVNVSGMPSWQSFPQGEGNSNKQALEKERNENEKGK